MNFSTFFLLILYAALIYLHIKQSPLICQHDIKIAKTLALVLIILIGVNSAVAIPLTPDLQLLKTIAYAIANWTLMILIYWRLLAGCYKDAFFKKNNAPDAALRDNVKETLAQVAKTNRLTPAFNLFIKTRFDDALIDSIRDQCERLAFKGPVNSQEHFSQENLTKLKDLAARIP